MRPKSPPIYLGGYPIGLVTQVQHLIEQDKLADVLLKKYPQGHAVRSDKALYDYVQEIKNDYLRSVGQLSKVAFDSKLQVKMCIRDRPKTPRIPSSRNSSAVMRTMPGYRVNWEMPEVKFIVWIPKCGCCVQPRSN